MNGFQNFGDIAINHFKSINKKSSKEARSIILTDVTSHTYFEKKNFNNTSKNLKIMKTQI